MIQCGLYIHIPFCVKKCNYCDFLSKNASEETIEKYVNALKKELYYRKDLYEDRNIKTIYIGGGTPSFINKEYIETILNKVYECFHVDKDVEATIEINPGTVTKEKLITYKKNGINRISFGLQSANNKELNILGRIHTYEEFEKNYKLARKVGFSNISIDLMSAIPNQTIESYKETIEKIVLLNPEHVSSYSLIIEEGTLFYKNREILLLPNEDDERKMYYMTNSILENEGYHRYEISNYCKVGYESKHNSSYWKGVEYIGVGLGASSYINKVRFKNTDNMDNYLKNEYLDKEDSIKYEKKVISKRQNVQTQIEEFMFLGLRMTQGVSKNEFNEKFEKDIYEIYGDVIRKYIKWNMMTEDNDRIKLTNKGIDLSNKVLSEFLY